MISRTVSEAPGDARLMRLPFSAALSLVMTDTLAQFAGGIAYADDPRPRVGLDRLLDGPMLAALLAWRRGAAGVPDQRAVVSLWALAYFKVALPPLLSANILLDRMPRLGLVDISFVLTRQAEIEAIQVHGDVPVRSADRFGSLLTDHLIPFVDHAAKRGQVTRRVIWNNAGHIFEAFLTMLEDVAAERPGLAEARAFLAAPTLPSGTANPLFNPVRYAKGLRIRRVCCLRCLVPEWPLCAICPLPEDSPARTRSPAALR